jgi:hypothetical protein
MRFITMMGTAALTMTAASHAQSILINEIRTGSNNAEYIELKGTPGASLAGMSIVVIGDGTSTGTAITRTGVVEWLYHFAATDVIGKNGFLVLHNPGQNTEAGTADSGGAFPFTPAAGSTVIAWPRRERTDPITGAALPPIAKDTQIESPDNQTYLLVTGYSGTDTFITRAPNDGSGGQDLDTNDDGTLDVTPWTSIVDNVVLKETNGSTPLAGQEWWYGTNFCGPYIFRALVTSGAPIAKWSIPNAVPANTTGATFAYGAADSGANAAGSALRGVHVAAATAWSSPQGPAGQGDFAFSSNNWTTNDFYEAVASTQGFTGVTLEFDQTRSNTGPASFRVDMSVDGGASFTTVVPDYAVTTSWSHKVAAEIPGAASQESVIFRIINATATTSAATGTNRIDNVLIRSSANQSTVVTRYGGPVHGYRTSTGTWAIGTENATTNPMDTVGSENLDPATYACGNPGAGDCGTAHNNAFCADSCCCEYVCTADPFCCQVRWDSFCAEKAAECAANCTAQPCPADFDADGTVGGADLGLLLGSWGGSELDLNADGIVNGADLGVLLGAWGACP